MKDFYGPKSRPVKGANAWGILPSTGWERYNERLMGKMAGIPENPERRTSYLPSKALIKKIEQYKQICLGDLACVAEQMGVKQKTLYDYIHTVRKHGGENHSL